MMRTNPPCAYTKLRYEAATFGGLEMLKKIAAASSVLGFLLACAAQPESKEEAVDEATSDFSVSDTKIAGSLGYGETSALTSYKFTGRSRYFAFKFAGNEGDEIDVWVKSSNGDPVTWVLDNDWRVVGKNDDASSSNTNSHVVAKLPKNASATHYIVVRDYWLDPMSFKVTLQGKSADFVSGCNVDDDCVKVEKSCCPIGKYTGVRSDAVASYQASLGCQANQVCPKIMIRDDHSMAECNKTTHKCEVVLPKDIQCGGFIQGAHECPAGYNCHLTVGRPDMPGKCAQFCGGIAGFQCSDPNEECVDDPNDGCDPAAGGADCGGMCQAKTSGTGVPCGTTTCAVGDVCCNPLMNICTKPGMFCIQ